MGEEDLTRVKEVLISQHISMGEVLGSVVETLGDFIDGFISCTA